MQVNTYGRARVKAFDDALNTLHEIVFDFHSKGRKHAQNSAYECGGQFDFDGVLGQSKDEVHRCVIVGGCNGVSVRSVFVKLLQNAGNFGVNVVQKFFDGFDVGHLKCRNVEARELCIHVRTVDIYADKQFVAGVFEKRDFQRYFGCKGIGEIQIALQAEADGGGVIVFEVDAEAGGEVADERRNDVVDVKFAFFKNNVDAGFEAQADGRKVRQADVFGFERLFFDGRND